MTRRQDLMQKVLACRAEGIRTTQLEKKEALWVELTSDAMHGISCRQTASFPRGWYGYALFMK